MHYKNNLINYEKHNSHFTSLEVSIRLKELGVKQESMFTWIKPKSSAHLESIYYGNTSDSICSAFLLPELIVLAGELCFCIDDLCINLTPEIYAHQMISEFEYSKLKRMYS